MNIRAVESQRDLRAFIDLPYRLYGRPRVGAAAAERAAQPVDPKRNPFLDHCEWQLFLAEDQGGSPDGARLSWTSWRQISGRSASACSATWSASVSAAARLLLEAARDWLLGARLHLHGRPWSFVSQEWGWWWRVLSPRR